MQGGVKSTQSSPQLRVGVILTDPEPVREALLFSYSDSFQLNQLRLWKLEAVRVKYRGSRGHSGCMRVGRQLRAVRFGGASNEPPIDIFKFYLLVFNLCQYASNFKEPKEQLSNDNQPLRCL